MEVDREGTTTSHVFRGAVRVQLAAGDGQQPREVVLRDERVGPGGEGRKRRAARLLLQGAAGNPPKFVRRLVEPPKVLDLLDIVAGGDGTGHHRERGIDPTTGMEDPVFRAYALGGDRQYKPVTWHPLIDGVFIPHGGAGAVQLDSAGHVFERFPKAVAETFGSIWARAAVVRRPQDYPNDPQHWIFWVRHAQQFMPEGRGLLAFHANVGLTFDLEAVRQAYPESRPVRFRAMAGLADAHRFLEPDNVADLWVFVDGQLKLSRVRLCPKDGTVAVNVALRPNDRFLTLVSTDGSDSNGCAWLVFGDPVVEMAAPAPNGVAPGLPTAEGTRKKGD